LAKEEFPALTLGVMGVDVEWMGAHGDAGGRVTQRLGQEEKGAKYGENEPKRSQFLELWKSLLSDFGLLR
jgi:hypothetical protein